jgi:hypothetical protein
MIKEFEYSSRGSWGDGSQPKTVVRLLKNGVLRTREYPYRNDRRFGASAIISEVKPTTNEWAKFEAICEEVGVWSWGELPLEPICDGDIWALRIQDSSRDIKIRSVSAVPTHGDRFFDALEKLIGGDI